MGKKIAVGPKSSDKSGLFLYYWKLLGHKEVPTAEYHFDRELGRRHRFDWAFVDEKVAVEVDGGSHAVNGGRHATDSDREKLNIAAMLGWRVYRFSPQALSRDPSGCIDLVAKGLLE